MKDILDLKHSFENIKSARSDILNIFNTVKSKLATLNNVYQDMICLLYTSPSPRDS